MKFYKTSEFKNLNSVWRDRLKEEFVDLEDSQENLKQHNRRTCLFDDRDEVLDFFLRLDEYLLSADIPPLYRNILELYTKGVYVKEIGRRLGISREWAHRIIKRYKKIIK